MQACLEDHTAIVAADDIVVYMAMSHRPDFRTQQCLVCVWRPALCHISRMRKGAAATRMLLLALARLNLVIQQDTIRGK